MNILQSGLNNVVLTASASSNFMDRYPKALLNTLIGMGVVFVVLICISIIISLIKFVPRIFNGSGENVNSDNKNNQSNQGNLNNAYNNTSSSEELVNDTELVAVITAAIMAYMGEDAPVDGLVVRSIRKVNRKNWQNA